MRILFAFFVWTAVAGLCAAIGLQARKAGEPVRFFTFTDPPKIENVKAYNRRVARLWFVFAFLLELLGLPFLFVKQNSPVFLVPVFGVIGLVIWLILRFLSIERTCGGRV